MQLLLAILTALDPYQHPPVEYAHPPVVAAVKAPHIIATVADRGCGPCERWKLETLPALEKAGWRVQLNVVPFGSETVPSFRCGSRVLEGYTTRAAFYSWVKPTGPSATGAVARGVAAVPVVSYSPLYFRGYGVLGADWSWRGDLREHLARTHRIDASGMSDAQAIATHDAMHGGR